MSNSIKARQERIARIRQVMQSHGIDALIIPSADPHMSEYLPEYWQGRAWVSGFTGSVGTLVLTHDTAGLWTDSRYWVQAPIQLDGTGIELQKMEQNHPTFGQFLADYLPDGAVVAIDGAVLSVAEFDRLNEIFCAKNIRLMTKLDVLAEVWQDRCGLPCEPIYPHPSAFVDVSALDKLSQVRQKMQTLGADFHLISSLDDIAWLTNLRGMDVSFNPVFLSHLLICADGATLFVDGDKLDAQAKAALQEAGIQVADYDSVVSTLATVSGSLLIDPAKVAINTIASVPKSVHIQRAMSPSTVLKAVKTDRELGHVREAMRQDGAALCEFFSDFERRIHAGETLNEVDIDTLLNDARSRQPHHVCASFDTIAGFRGNGAIVHYRAEADTCATLQGDGLLLIDSGAQYYNGTTDITRMASVGVVCDDAKKDVTYVLKAHIALARAVYPMGIPSAQLDVLARNELWQQGLDYGHGTGHGVGYFLNVHEGPQVISRNAPTLPERTMQYGMITSNEPGLYREGKWGIRLENLVATVPAHHTEFGEFARFEDLTLCPFDTRLILPNLLTKEEKDWLNSYHKKVHDELIDRVDGDAKAWLIERTQAI
ncbi:aminopeptidase P family protein [Moraxella nasibovis]|uniref:aminopeptidase P family protein n=1 Tax=Moraxella nasibovis TaxID=2904120 RepID=UPI00240F0E21|nr:aminopeptidase P family protein [Moraxella nasibovis]WFF38450.1 aminopeptidase P family protein [Moraxella nasibovis]